VEWKEIAERIGAFYFKSDGRGRFEEIDSKFFEVINFKPDGFYDLMDEIDLGVLRKCLGFKSFSIDVDFEAEDRTIYFKIIAERVDDHYEGVIIELTKIKVLEKTIEELKANLRRAEALFDTIMASIDDVFVILDRKGRIEYANKKFEKITGFPLDELKGKKLSDFVAEGTDIGDLTSSFRTFELELTSRRGKYLLEFNTKPVRLDIGGVSREIVIGTGRDVTERKRISYELEESERRYREASEFLQGILDYAPVPITAWDTNMNMTLWNKASEEIFGWKAEEVLGRNLLDLQIPLRERKRVEELIREVMNKGVTKRNINPSITKSGDERIFEWYNFPVRDYRGIISGGASIGIDLTDIIGMQRDLKRSETKYKELSEFLQKMIKIAPVAIVVWDENLEITSWNDTSERMFGFKRDEVIGRNFAELFAERDSVEDWFLNLISTDGYHNTIAENITKYGRRVFEWYSFAFSKNGVSIGMDITDRMNMERMLRLSEEKFRKIFEESPNAIAILNERGEVMDANRTFSEYFGAKRGDRLIEDLANKLPSEQIKVLKQAMIYVMDTQESTTVEHRIKGRLLQSSFIPLTLETGRSCVLISKDLTEIISLNKLLNTVNNINKLLVRIKNEGELVNRVCEEFSRMEEYDTIWIGIVDGEVIKAVASIRKDEMPEVVPPQMKNLTCMQISRASGEVVLRLPWSVKCLDCEYYPFHKSKIRVSIPMRVENEVRGVINLISKHKVPSEKELELLQTLADDLAFGLKALELEREKRKALEQIERNIENFAILIDHIRNPLTNILGITELKVEDEEVRAIVTQQVNRIEKVIERLDEGWLESEVIRDFLKKY
jgi:PAS domain S-box-containing protein